MPEIHRCRFIEYPPSAINTLAFSHTSGSAGLDQPLRLAIGRANGNIEIWNPHRGSWVHETTLYGGRQRTVDGLAWIHDPEETEEGGVTKRGRLRLFSIGYSTSVTEWDLCTGLPLRQSTGSHAEIWCISSQPPWKQPRNPRQPSNYHAKEHKAQHLVAGCADGSLVLLSTEDDRLDFQKFIARPSKTTARALCMTWRNRHTLVAGYADSAIRIYDIRNGNTIRHVTLPGGPKGAPKETLVWALECLADGTIVSGDSTGEICFWDGKNYGQLQRIKSHEADILCLSSSTDGKTVMSGGMDRRTVVYRLDEGAPYRRWGKTAHRRFHRHDVKAMARFENENMSVVVSGGLDANPIVTPLREFGSENHRTLPYTPQYPPVASTANLLVGWWGNEVSIWRLNRRDVAEDLEHAWAPQKPDYEVVARLSLKGEEYITSASISADGDLLAVATVAEVKMFQLRPRKKNVPGELKVKKLDTPTALAKLGARLLQFSPDTKWLLAVSSKSVSVLARVVPPHNAEDRQYTVHTALTPLRRSRQPNDVPQNCLSGPWGSYYRAITRAAFSSDSRMLAVSDLSGRIDTWILEENEDMNAVGTSEGANALDDSSSSSDSESDSDSGSNSQSETSHRKRTKRKSQRSVLGQTWLPNPLNHSIPKLPAAILVLSFRPIPQTSFQKLNKPSTHLTNGATPSTSSAKNPPADRLLALTTTHELYELSIHTGTFTPWSRRNPPTLLPYEFKVQSDRAAGCVWETQQTGGKTKTRLWIYGSSWLCMFDMEQDLPRSHDSPSEEHDSQQHLTNGASNPADEEVPKSLKRKRPVPTALSEKEEHYRMQLKHKQPTGAGGLVKEAELAGDMSKRSVRRIDEDGEEHELPSSKRPRSIREGEGGEEQEVDDEGEVDDLDESDSGDADVVNEHGEPDADADADVDNAVTSGGTTKKKKYQRKGFFLTTRYRPVLAVCAINTSSPSSSASDGTAAEAKGKSKELQLAVVERPPWDVDAMDGAEGRFVGRQEWDK